MPQLENSPAERAPSSDGELHGTTWNTYDPAYFTPLYASEDRHFWFRARNRVIASLVNQITAKWNTGFRVLEVGCGTGNVLRVLENACPRGAVVGMDLFGAGLRYASRRTTCDLVQGDIDKPPFGASFDLIGLFDVLEHLPDDNRVLLNLHAMLKPGGVLLLTVPAHPWLWSYFDEVSHHCRRYRLPALKEQLATAGYGIDFATQYMALLFPAVWLGRRLAAPRRPRNSQDQLIDELRVVPFLNESILWLLAGEAAWLARRRSLPVGTSLLVVARRT